MWIQIAFFANSVLYCYGHYIADFISIDIFPDNECGNQLKAFKTALGNDETWSLSLLDASAKLQSGILSGNIFNLGDFDECLAVKGETSVGIIEGKYCLASTSLEGLGIFIDKELRRTADRISEDMHPQVTSSGIYARAGLCIPSACTADDINEIINNTLSIKFKVAESNCQIASRGLKITSGDVATMYIACIFGLLLITSTAYDIYLYYSNKACKSTLLLSFSILKNGRKLFTTIIDNDKYLSCLDGIRTLTLMWIILAHSFSMGAFQPLTNYRSMYEFAQNTWSMYIIGAMASVDTFFLVSGTVLAYGFLTHTKQFRMVDLPAFYFHRYIRLIPCLAAILLVHITVLKHIGSGPMWTLSEALNSDCDQTWWKYLTFTQNLSHTNCMIVAWYVSCDTQLYMVSPLILIQLRKRPRQVLKIIALLALLSISYSFLSCWLNNYTPFRQPTDEYMSASTRASPWLIGIVLGYIIYNTKCNNLKLEINKFLVTFLWIASAAVMIACVFGGNHLVTDSYGHRLESALRISLVRPAWALAVGWILFACVSGYGGPINEFLSLPIFQILSRFGYSMYLLHRTILSVVSMSTRISIHESNLRQIYMFWSIYMLTLFVSVIWTLTFELPFVAMENYFLRDNKKHGKGAPQEQSDTNYIKVKI